MDRRLLCMLVLSLACVTDDARGQDGALDTTFGTGGLTLVPLTSMTAEAVVVQPDDRIVVGATRYSGGAQSMVVMRLLADGGMDSSFGIFGITELDFGGEAVCAAVALQPDGRVLVGGHADLFGNDRLVLARLTADGIVDSSFAGDGMVVSGIGNYNRGSDVVLQPDGRILLVGNAYEFGDHVAVARFTSAGLPDNTWDSDGEMMVQIGPDDQSGVHGATLRADGRLLLAMSTSVQYRFTVACLTTWGVPDADFGTNGATITDAAPGWQTFALRVRELADGRIVALGVASNVDNTDQNIVLGRYLPEGTPDPSFGTNGFVVTDMDSLVSGNDIELIALPDGRLLVAGAIRWGLYAHTLLVRYNADGDLDTSFGTGGRLIFNFDDYDHAHGAALQSDLRLVVAGTAGTGVGQVLVTRHFSGMQVGLPEGPPWEVHARAHPVPAADAVTIEYVLPAAAVVRLQLHDAQGRCVRVVHAPVARAAGAHRETIDLRGLASGSYAVVLRSADRSSVVRVVKAP